MPIKTMVHLNHNIMCAVDVETTGLEEGYHELIQLACIPLDNNLHTREDLPIFDIYVKPNHVDRITPDTMKFNRDLITRCIEQGIERFAAIELFEHWFQSLNLPDKKSIVPLGHCYPFDRGFIRNWMGHQAYDTYFFGHSRDTLSVASFLNDRADFHGNGCPFPKLGLSQIASRVQVEVIRDRTHDAVYDAYITAQVYRKLLKEFFE